MHTLNHAEQGKTVFDALVEEVEARWERERSAVLNDVAELLRNACRATVTHHRNSGAVPPPVRVVVVDSL